MADKKITEKKETEAEIEIAAALAEELTTVFEEIKEEPVEEKKKEGIAAIANETDIQIGEREYRTVKDYRDAFDPERLGEWSSEALTRYDHTIGDWGYEQLHLHGFLDTSSRWAAPDQRIGTLEDYLYGYCSLGYTYFVIERTGGCKEKTAHHRRRHKENNCSNTSVEEKSVPTSKSNRPMTHMRREENKKTIIPEQPSPRKSGKGFTIH